MRTSHISKAWHIPDLVFKGCITLSKGLISIEWIGLSNLCITEVTLGIRTARVEYSAHKCNKMIPCKHQPLGFKKKQLLAAACESSDSRLLQASIGTSVWVMPYYPFSGTALYYNIAGWLLKFKVIETKTWNPCRSFTLKPMCKLWGYHVFQITTTHLPQNCGRWVVIYTPLFHLPQNCGRWVVI